jgi:hypothetical protein
MPMMKIIPQLGQGELKSKTICITVLCVLGHKGSNKYVLKMFSYLFFALYLSMSRIQGVECGKQQIILAWPHHIKLYKIIF